MKDKPQELYVTVIQIYPQSVDISIICLGQEFHINDTEKFSQDWFCIELLLKTVKLFCRSIKKERMAQNNLFNDKKSQFTIPGLNAEENIMHGWNNQKKTIVKFCEVLNLYEI